MFKCVRVMAYDNIMSEYQDNREEIFGRRKEKDEGQMLDWKGLHALGWVDKAARYIAGIEDELKDKKDLVGEDWKVIDALGEYFATGEANDIEGLENEMGWCGQWEVKKAANSYTRELGIDEIKWPEVEDDYVWWHGETCEFGYHAEGERQYRVCENDVGGEGDGGGEYDQKAYCSEHYDYMISEAPDECVECGKFMFVTDILACTWFTGDPDERYCPTCQWLLEGLEGIE